VIKACNLPLHQSAINRAVVGSFQAVIGGHVSYAKGGHKLACHIWLERSGSLLTPPSEITQFGVHLPDKKIKYPSWSEPGFSLHGLKY